MPDVINNQIVVSNLVGGASALLGQIRLAALAAGWVIDEYDTFPTNDAGGPELYLHTNVNGFAQQSYFSIKAFLGEHADQSGLTIYANTGYSSARRVDNQPGMFARRYALPQNAVSATEVFSGLWDQGGANGSPIDQGQYRTAAYPGTGPVPRLAKAVPHLNCPQTSLIDNVWIFHDQVVSGGSRSLSVVWYVENQMYALSFGKVHYDNEGASPDNVDGNLLACWLSKHDDRATLLPPSNNAVGGSRTSLSAGDSPFAIVRNKTVGAETWPAGTPDGNPLLGVGTVVLSNGRLEANDGVSLTSGSCAVRPESYFDSLTNELGDVRFPNPRLLVHRETYGSIHRIGLSRQRVVSRWPDGGSIFGINGAGAGPPDWSDSRYVFPWYVACCLGEIEGSTVTNGTRQYRLFPGNRGGADLFASHRKAGLAFRIA